MPVTRSVTTHLKLLSDYDANYTNIGKNQMAGTHRRVSILVKNEETM